MQNVQVVANRARNDGWAPASAGMPAAAKRLPELLSDAPGEDLDALTDTVAFIKDTEGRYTYANQTLVRRLGFSRREEVIGRSEAELYPEALFSAHPKQDERVLQGETIDNELQVLVLPNHAARWCLTHKQPLEVDGEIRGIVVRSQDVSIPETAGSCPTSLRRVFEYLREHYTESVRVYALADMVGMSMTQLDKHFRARYRLTPQQMLTRLRIDLALRMLNGNDSMAAISQACGFADQSAFTRQFRATVGMTPRSYRTTVRTAAVAG